MNVHLDNNESNWTKAYDLLLEESPVRKIKYICWNEQHIDPDLPDQQPMDVTRRWPYDYAIEEMKKQNPNYTTEDAEQHYFYVYWAWIEEGV